MRVLMLGWEFPPYISGGLGTACFGLTQAMSEMGVEVTFALPHTLPLHDGSHVSLVGCPLSGPASAHSHGGVRFRPIPSPLSNPYATATTTLESDMFSGPLTAETSNCSINQTPHRNDDDSELFVNVRRYAEQCAELLRDEPFDVIHAHDWMTFPTGNALAQLTGKPLVIHVHSTELDRSGERPHSRIFDIERVGMHAASAIICVSRMTKAAVVTHYGVPDEKVEVVYNGIAAPDAQISRPKGVVRDRVVLFLGRVTIQKGPEYFVAAAKKVLEKVDDVKFVIAGAGDMLRQIIEQVVRLGIGHKVLFTGFLRGPEVDLAYEQADLYVMPSVSEPFGIAPLEAIRHGVPVLLSKNSGVSEVIRHALKVDFWDVDDMANKIIGVLRHPPLGATLCKHASVEIEELTWKRAATACLGVYERAFPRNNIQLNESNLK